MLDNTGKSFNTEPPVRRVLVAEDDPLQQKIAALRLAKLGIGADIAANGAQAVQATAARAYLFVLMDCQMPLLDGLQATARIRERELVTMKHVPIIGCSAHSNRDACLDAGMDDFVQKPCPSGTLSALVSRYAEQHLPRYKRAET